MMTLDSTYYEDLQGRLRGLFVTGTLLVELEIWVVIVAAAIVILLAIGIALLIPLRQTCPPGETLTTTGWNEAAPRCYTKPIAQLERGTPLLEQSRVDIQVIIVSLGLRLATGSPSPKRPPRATGSSTTSSSSAWMDRTLRV
jgi:hypothetical protein